MTKKTNSNDDVVRGFGNYMDADLARSAVIYLEKEDPRRRHREKVVCAVNVGDFELRYAVDPKAPEKTSDDGRTVRRKMWDEAVQALVRITSSSGLRAKFARNDKNSCRFTLKQDEVHNDEHIPDEFFCMELYYCSEFQLEREKLEYVRRIDKFDQDIRACRRLARSWMTPKVKREELLAEISILEAEKKFYLSTTPDPREMDSGLIFKIEFYTLKEYAVTKEKLKSVLAEYLGALSQIAAAYEEGVYEELDGEVEEDQAA